MADRPRDDDWWLASDGKWYPPELRPDSPDWDRDPTDTTGGGVALSGALTNAVSILVGVASALLMVAAFFGFRYASELPALGDDAGSVTRDPTASELAFAGWLMLAGVLLAVAAVTTLVWIFQASRVADARGATGRRWRGGWAIGVWVIPIANFVLPKLLFNELEKVFQVPFDGVPVDDAWRSRERTGLADLWWALWVGGSAVSLWSWFSGPGAEATAGDVLASSVRLTSITMLLTAAAGVVFIPVVRRIVVFSTR